MRINPALLLRICLLGWTLACAPGRAQSQPIDASVFSVLSLDASARVAALGGSAAASPAGEPAGMFYNPALLDSTIHDRLGITYLNHLSDLQAGMIAFGRHYPGLGSFAVGVRFLNWGSIPRTDASGLGNGAFRAGEAVLSLSGSRRFGEQIRYGATVHWMRSGIDGRTTGALAADVGAILHAPESRFSAGVSLRHAGFDWSPIGSDANTLPLDLSLSISQRLQHLPLLLNLTFYDLTDPGSGSEDATGLGKLFYHLRLGGEFQFSPAFQLRFGYDHRRHDALKIKSRLDFAGVSMGTGIRVRGVAIDYARTSWSSLGALHRFTLATGL
jgi:hypothetical protein